jgi:hypothetical protein
MREKMAEMQSQMEQFITTLNQELAARPRPQPPQRNSLIPVVNFLAPGSQPRKGRRE